MHLFFTKKMRTWCITFILFPSFSLLGILRGKWLKWNFYSLLSKRMPHKIDRLHNPGWNIYSTLIIRTINKNILDLRQSVVAATGIRMAAWRDMCARKSADTKRPTFGTPDIYRILDSMQRSEMRAACACYFLIYD